MHTIAQYKHKVHKCVRFYLAQPINAELSTRLDRVDPSPTVHTCEKQQCPPDVHHEQRRTNYIRQPGGGSKRGGTLEGGYRELRPLVQARFGNVGLIP